MNFLIYPFMALAALGLVLSIIVHIASLFGLPLDLPFNAMSLHTGIFVVWFPAVIVAYPITRDVPRRDQWRAMLRGCPDWLRYLAYGFFAYAIVNFFLFFTGQIGTATSSIGETPGGIVRGFSGHWMVFYCMAFAIFYSALQREKLGLVRRCPQGHQVSLSAKYCEKCGETILER